MRKFLLSLCVALLSCATFAQYNVIVELIDGTEVRYSAKNVKNIRIEKGDSTQTDEEVVDAATSDFTFFILNDKEAEVISLDFVAATVVNVPAYVRISGKVYTVTSIGSGSFDYSYNPDLTKIKKVVLPNTIKSIGEYAFKGCTSLTSIEIPNSVTEIGEHAFDECHKLTSIVIPNSVTEIGSGAFYECNLTSIVVDKDNKVYDSRENCNALIETASNTLIYGCQNTVIPNSVTEIGEYAFYECYNLTSINIPNSVTEIGSGAFGYCHDLTSINIPNSVTEIGSGAFAWCESLTSIVIPSSVTEIGKRAFGSCTHLTSIVVDKDNKVYDSRENCNALIETASNTLIYGCQNTVIPNSVTEIGNEAFSNCNLTSINIPNSVTEIGEYAFFACNLTSINITNSVTVIGDGAFYYCNLTSIEIPKSVTEIGDGAFYGCYNLKTARVPESLRGKVGNVFPSTCEIEYY
ncbi:MAG: leucine-rich repeat domain-containing protein [Bacilli bacterium]|nr:leucine-rich repeat domain-containing protein [Bacilli bacterium]